MCHSVVRYASGLRIIVENKIDFNLKRNLMIASSVLVIGIGNAYLQVVRVTTSSNSLVLLPSPLFWEFEFGLARKAASEIVNNYTKKPRFPIWNTMVFPLKSGNRRWYA